MIFDGIRTRVGIASPYISSILLYKISRGPRTLMPALIKVEGNKRVFLTKAAAKNAGGKNKQFIFKN